MGGSRASSESQMLEIGLKFGQKVYFGDVGVGESESGSSPASGPGAGGGGGPQKKGRTEVGFQQPPRCQVEGCNLDLSDAKTYYSRHKVCAAHSKTPKVIVNGLEQRFCQQCSRFHLLEEFDQGKRSCRRRLAGHNERRRKPSLGMGTPLASRYASLPTIFGDNDTNNSGAFLMDFSSYSRTRAPWPNPRPPPRAGVTNEFPPLPWQSNLDNPPPYINGVQDSTCALSLLSNHSSGSRSQSLEYYANPDACAPMAQPMVQGHFAPSMAAWAYDPGEAHVGLGQLVQSGYTGELGLGQNQGGKECDSSAEYVHWSL